MDEPETPEAWVRIQSASERAETREKGNPYDFGFRPAMGSLLLAHPAIGPTFLALYAQIMFAPEGALNRAERELTAAVAAAAQDCFY